MKYINKRKTPKFLSKLRKLDKKMDYKGLRKKTYSYQNKEISYCSHNGTKADFNKDESLVMGKLEQALLREQGYLCAYCTKLIPEYRINDKGEEWCKVKVEHWFPQSTKESINKRKDTDYKNMLICCYGGDRRKKKDSSKNDTNNSKEDDITNHKLKADLRTCDTKKEKKFIVVNPLNRHHIDLLKYTVNGEIYCLDISKEELEKRYKELMESKGEKIEYKKGKDDKNPPVKIALFEGNLTTDEIKLAIDYDIRITLNLNKDNFKKARKNSYKIISREVREKFKQKKFYSENKKSYLNKRIDYYLNHTNSNDQFEPFCMVKVYYLKERLANLGT